MARRIKSLIFNKVSSRKTMPDQNTAPRATGQGILRVATAVKVKKALRPIPGATRTGLRAYRPIMRVLKNETRTVAVSTPEKGMPVWLRIDGFTTIIYDVARKEDIPARISVERGVGWLCCSVYDFIHRDSHMAFIVDAFTVADQQDLGRFVLYEEGFGDPVGNGPVADEI